MYNEYVFETLDQIPPDFVDLLPLLIQDEAFVAGGVFKDIAAGNKPKDIDVFFYNVGGYNNAVEKFRNSAKYEYKYSTPNSMGFTHISSDTLVDLVCYQFGTPREVLERFDFTVCQAALFIRPDGMVANLKDISFDTHVSKKLLWVNQAIANPDITFNRMLRYINYGYSVSDDLKVRLFNSIRSTEPTDISPINKTY